jgi:predicted AlkP superfamily pyrophosphatase or phosphodiesterase
MLLKIKSMKRLFKYSFIARIVVVILAIVLTGCNALKQNNQDNYVVMLSLDAFRWDYPLLANTPSLMQIAENGVTAEALIPCYPSKTFPNHYSMATGLYPNNHGIVSNRFFDAELGFYSIGDRAAVENADFYGGEPIWLTAERQGVKAATYYWVGSEAPIGGVYPSQWRRYRQDIPFDNRIDTVIQWLSLPVNERPRLIAFYHHEPDWTAHRYGATGAETLALVEHIDSLVGVFLRKVSELPHAKNINIIIVSDHGMADTSPERYINLNNYINRDWFDYITGGNPVYSLQPKAEYREQAIAALKSIPNLKAWERHEIPARLHYGSNPRIHDILIEADAGYSVGLGSDSSRYTGATHGWDNEQKEMHGIFFAQGPAFKKGYRHKAFMNTNLYTIIAHILRLDPAKTDGEWSEVKDIFVD